VRRCSVVFLVWSSFMFLCMATAYRTVYWSFISITFAVTRWGSYNALINGTCCMPMERVDRPGESQEATGGKKREDVRRCEKM